MINKHEVERTKYSKMPHAESLATVHTHTHTLYVYQIDKKENNIKNRRKNLWKNARDGI